MHHYHLEVFFVKGVESSIENNKIIKRFSISISRSSLSEEDENVLSYLEGDVSPAPCPAFRRSDINVTLLNKSRQLMNWLDALSYIHSLFPFFILGIHFCSSSWLHCFYYLQSNQTLDVIKFINQHSCCKNYEGLSNIVLPYYSSVYELPICHVLRGGGP